MLLTEEETNLLEGPEGKPDYEEGFNNLSLAAMAKKHQDNSNKLNLPSHHGPSKD